MPHFVEPRISKYGSDTEVCASFECTEPEGSFCRMICENGCEEHPRFDEEGQEVECGMKPYGQCWLVEQFNDEPFKWLEYYKSDTPNMVAHSGVIIPQWDGDCWVWSYPEDAVEYAYGPLGAKQDDVSRTTLTKQELMEFLNLSDDTEQLYIYLREKPSPWRVAVDYR